MLLRYWWYIDKIDSVFWIAIFVLLNGIFGQYLEYSPSQSPIDLKYEADQFIKEYNREASDMCNRVTTFEWRYEINSTEYNKRRTLEQKSISSKFECISWRRAMLVDVQLLTDDNVKRQYERIFQKSHCGLGDIKLLELQHILTLMKDNYNNAKTCPYPGNRLAISDRSNYEYPHQNHDVNYHLTTITAPENYVRASATYCDLKSEDVTRLMQKSRSEAELRHLWVSWRDVTGPSIRNTFMRYVDLVNQGARAQGFRDGGDQSRSAYDDRDFYFTVQDLWYNVQPLYKQLFTYVRKGLYHYYGEKIVRIDGPIPAHVLGNMWAQNWQSIIDIIKPGHREMPDISGEMVRQGYTPLRIFQAAEEFFTSLGLSAMLPEFWRNSVLQKPNDVFTKCSASSWDFCNNIDFRIKQCTQISLDDYVSAHREMAHIQYFMQYSGQPYLFRDGPNPAFHEAMANAIGLSVSNPVHLQKIGLLSKQLETESGNSMINIEYLLSMALERLPLMAFSMSLEKWRWHVFEKGPIGMNGRWWELQLRYMGIIPATTRTNDNFDPGSKYHIIADEEYMKYFVGTILQFQIFYELCLTTNHNGPLHTCDIYRSREAGKLLMEVMQKGASLPTDQLLSLLTKGKTSRLDVIPFLEYFRPLEAWLEIQNRNEKIIGWNSNMDDVNLFQSFYASKSSQISYTLIVGFLSVIFLYIFSYYNNFL